MALRLKWRGKEPPAGASWMKDKVPSLMSWKVEIESDLPWVPSGKVMVNEESFRFEMTRKRLSGCDLLALEDGSDGKIATHADMNLGRSVALGCLELVSVGAAFVDLAERETAAVGEILDGIASHRGGQFGDDVEVGGTSIARDT